MTAPLHSVAGATALITGAGRGIGAAAARHLAVAGAAEITLVSRTRSELETTKAEVERHGARGQIAVCDVRDATAMREVIAKLPRLDLLVNNAGTNIPALLVDVKEQDLDDILALNVRSTILVAQAAVRKMLEIPLEERRRGGVSIVNISSQMGRVGSPRRTVYCATKHAVDGFTKALAVELAPEGIRVNAVAPTFLDTPLTAPFFANDPSFAEWVLNRIPMGRLGTVNEVASVITFLASPAAAFVTGESIAVDGGWTAQ
jgi:NAD(P)-dependent dehydrogenase (short-subunit alcohol dehydrogenase family)